MSFEHDAQRGKIGTKQFILPVLRKIGGGEVIHTEEQASHFERCLDFHSIDGFIKSVKRFNMGYDYKMSTFAVPYIMGEIKKFIRDDGMLKVSRRMKELSFKIKEIEKDFVSENH